MSAPEKTKERTVELDPLLVEAARDVDRALLTWTRSLSLRQRLDAASAAARTLRRFKRASTTG